MRQHFKLRLLADRYAVFRLPPDRPLPDWASGEFVSVTRTPDELSIVCRERLAEPDDSRIAGESGWRCIQVIGPLSFSMVGVIASLTRSLAHAEISVFVVSTYETDYLLVKDRDLTAAVDALTAHGHQIVDD